MQLPPSRADILKRCGEAVSGNWRASCSRPLAVDDHSLIACKCCKGARAHEIEGQVANAEDRNMFTAVFHRQVQFRSQANLTGRFKSDRVTLAPGTELDLEGEVTLSPDIIFSGRCHLAGPIRVEIGSL